MSRLQQPVRVEIVQLMCRNLFVHVYRKHGDVLKMYKGKLLADWRKFSVHHFLETAMLIVYLRQQPTEPWKIESACCVEHSLLALFIFQKPLFMSRDNVVNLSDESNGLTTLE